MSSRALESIKNSKLTDNVMELIDFRIKKTGTNGKVSTLTFGINVYKVKEVIFKPTHINRIPSSIDCLEGMINLRGKVVPVINLQKKLGLSWEDIISPPNEVKTEYGDLITAITILEGGEIMLILDFEKIVGDMNADYYNVHVDVAALSAPIRVKTVLCVDDSSVARQLARKALEEVGYTVIEAINGVEGINILKEYAQKATDNNENILSHIGLIISDIEMPLMDGFTFTKNIKEDSALNPIPVILHSSLSRTVMSSRGENVGAVDFITKFNANSLIEAVNKV